MAKKQADKPVDTRAIIATLKGSVEFRDWLNRLAEFDRSSAVQVLEKAVVRYAREVGFAEAAPLRKEGRKP